MTCTPSEVARSLTLNAVLVVEFPWITAAACVLRVCVAPLIPNDDYINLYGIPIPIND